jgi:hypothetical protein
MLHGLMIPSTGNIYNHRKDIASVENAKGFLFERFNDLRRDFVIDKKIKPVWRIIQIHKTGITDVVITRESAHNQPKDARCG